MRILYVAPDVPVPHTGKFLGGSTHVLKISEKLAENGNSVLILSRRMQNQKKFENISDGVFTKRIKRGIVFSFQKPEYWRNEKESKRFIEKVYFCFYNLFLLFTLCLLKPSKFDCIIERNSTGGIGIFISRIFGLPGILEVIDSKINNFQLHFSRKIVTYTKRIIPSQFWFKTCVTHAGVDTNVFRPDKKNAENVRKKYGLNDRKVVVYVGELSAWHGTEIILDIAERMRDVTFLMVGKNLEMLSEEVERRKLGNIIFTGFIKHESVRDYISAGDVAIAPYKKTEEFFYYSPIKIFEYMACEVPVIASNVEIVRDTIERHRCGLLAEQNNVDDFVKKISFLLNESKLRKKMGRNGRKAVVKNYQWSNVAQTLINTIAQK
jgi:glycosyltransferase involved in cell wall biosynthesis